MTTAVVSWSDGPALVRAEAMYNECPGARQFKQPTPEFIPCPRCHVEVEIWTDEVEVKCHQCGETVSREQLQGCIDHCQMARECLGEQLYDRVVASRRGPDRGQRVTE
jgi:hypothetical protein